MNRSRFTTKHLLFLTVAIFVVGVVIDAAIVGPKMKKIESLAAERSALEAQMTNIASRKTHEGDLAAALGLSNLQVLLQAPEEDAVAYLGRTIEESGLTRLDLNTVDQKTSANLTLTKFSVRASGTYAEIHDFVRRLEGSSRLAAVQTLYLDSPLTGDNLEGRFNLIIYDPRVTR